MVCINFENFGPGACLLTFCDHNAHIILFFSGDLHPNHCVVMYFLYTSVATEDVPKLNAVNW